MTRNLSTTYATVASSLALLVALGGTSYAVTQIGTSQIKNNAVTTPKIKNGAVNGAKVKDGTVTGADVKESSLAKVPSAATADALAGGTRVVKVNFRGQNVTDVTVATLGELTVKLTCAGGQEALSATTTTMDNEIGVQSIESDNFDSFDDLGGAIDDDFNAGETFGFPIGASGNYTDRQYTFTYTAASGKGVTGHLTTEDEIGPDNCLVTGYLIG